MSDTLAATTVPDPNLQQIVRALWDEQGDVEAIVEQTPLNGAQVRKGLRTLSDPGLVSKDGAGYVLDKEELYTRFVSYLDNRLATSRLSGITSELLHMHSEALFWHDDIREHLLQYTYRKLERAEGFPPAIFGAYVEDGATRLPLLYKLNQTPLKDLPEDRHRFWQYLTILHGTLPLGNRTITDCQLNHQLFDNDDQGETASIIQEWNNCTTKAQQYLYELSTPEEIRKARQQTDDDLTPEEREILSSIANHKDEYVPLDVVKEETESVNGLYELKKQGLVEKDQGYRITIARNKIDVLTTAIE